MFFKRFGLPSPPRAAAARRAPREKSIMDKFFELKKFVPMMPFCAELYPESGVRDGCWEAWDGFQGACRSRGGRVMGNYFQVQRCEAPWTSE